MGKELIRRQREAFDEALRQRRLEAALELAVKLERVDRRNAARWAQRCGDIERRLGHQERAAEAYARAEKAYLDDGREREASAMRSTRLSTCPPPAN